MRLWRRPTEIRQEDLKESEGANSQLTSHGSIRYSKSVTGIDRPCGFQETEAPRLQDNRHVMVVTLSALNIESLDPLGNKPGTHFC